LERKTQVQLDEDTARIYDFNKRKGMTDAELRIAILSVLDASEVPQEDPLFQPIEKDSRE